MGAPSVRLPFPTALYALPAPPVLNVNRITSLMTNRAAVALAKTFCMRSAWAAQTTHRLARSAVKATLLPGPLAYNSDAQLSPVEKIWFRRTMGLEAKPTHWTISAQTLTGLCRIKPFQSHCIQNLTSRTLLMNYFDCRKTQKIKWGFWLAKAHKALLLKSELRIQIWNAVLRHLLQTNVSLGNGVL